jgi:Cu-Zn family superoxide dismutase
MNISPFRRAAFIRAALLFVVAAVAAPTTARLASAQAASARAELKDAKGQTVGTVQLTEVSGGVLLHASLSGVPPGVHAFHIHEVGTCDAPDFKSAGGHFNPGAQHHGFAAAGGPHAGDLPNIYVPASGQLVFDVVARGVTLASGPTSLFGPNGTSFVMHESADDYKSDPAGNAGARIACGVITR